MDADVASTDGTTMREEALRARVAELEAMLTTRTSELTARTSELTARTSELARVTKERDALRKAYAMVLEQLELLRHRITVAKAERIGDVAQLELEFAAKKAELDALVKKLDEMVVPAQADESTIASDDAPPPGPRKPGGGRRNLDDVAFTETQRIELTDPLFELTMERIGWEETSQIGYRPGAAVKVVTARAVYKTKTPEPEFATVPVPLQLLTRCLMAPSMLAHLVMSKVGYGLTFFRMEQRFLHEGIKLDRGSISRYFEDVGASLGATIVEAMRKDALANAFCLATDATGVAVQPTRLQDPKERRPCDKGHFFVVLADRDHVFFDYQAKHTSDAVCAMFRGFGGYLLSDAHVIYDALHRGEAVEPGKPAPIEVGCWSHCRRYFWEAAMMKHALGREGLLRLRALFEQEAKWRKLPPAKRLALRRGILRPLVDDFFAWVHAESSKHDERGPARSALGYALRQEQALRRFLDDARLPMTNNDCERALRAIAIGRKNWLFFGSGDHAAAAANLFSLVASCKLHGLDPERYLRDVIRVVPHWPRDRYLELSPKHWAATRSRLVPAELDAEVGDLGITAAPQE
jgi:hypothetical protein